MRNDLWRSYSELIKIPTYKGRLEYLQLLGKIGDVTFGGHRELNQILYHTREWKDTRRYVIMRDAGNDLGLSDCPIGGSIYIHHINPISIPDIIERRPCVFDLENLICCSFDTHNAIHYGYGNIPNKEPIVRVAGDTTPWKRLGGDEDDSSRL